MRGSFDPTHRLNLKTLIQESRANLICIQETKSGSWSSAMKNSVWNEDEHGWIFARAEGLSGGLLISWEKNQISHVSHQCSRSWIKLKAKVIATGEIFVVFNVYAPNKIDRKRELWETLSTEAQMTENYPTLMLGDFNSVRNATERMNCTYANADSHIFNGFIEDIGFEDIPTNHPKFTWHGPENKKSVLDRILINSKCSSKGQWQAKILSRKNSDHSPLYVSQVNEDWGAKPFRLFDWWLEDKSLRSEIKTRWEILSNRNVHQKLHGIKNFIKSWSKSNVGNLDQQIRLLEEEQKAADANNATDHHKKQIKEKLWKCYEGKLKSIKQKSRTLWSKLGDRNSKFFHRCLMKRRRRNQILGISSGNEWITKPSEVKKIFLEYFKSAFSNDGNVSTFKLGALFLTTLSEMEADSLVETFSIQEIEEALDMSDSNKAPGPDGLNTGFLKEMWDEMKLDMVEFFNIFHEKGFLPKGINDSYIALIPKTSSPTKVSEYRPISLINCSMKLLCKVLANRLKIVLPSIISESQSAFLKQRQITENVLQTNEIIHGLKVGKLKGLVLKLDFARAFDTINWEFFFECLTKMNFRGKWIMWLRSIFYSIRMSVLVNGSPTKDFKIRKGLRQGDPLSPLLFLMVGEVLNALLNTACRLEIFKGISFGERNNTISHIQFADDTILFLEASTSSVLGIKRVLQCFELLSGLKINFQKSSLYNIKGNKDDLSLWASILGCNMGQLPINYLGMELGSNPTRKLFWQPIMNKLKSQLANWQSRNLNQAGKLVLMKASLDSIPSYWLSIFELPKGVRDDIDRLRRDFFWGDGTANGVRKRKIHTINWKKLGLSKECGGLNIASIELRNWAMMGKWWWKFRSERGKQWVSFFQEMYGSQNSCNFSDVGIQPRMSIVLKKLISLKDNTLLKEMLAENKFSWKVMSGSKTLLWHDSWCGEEPLKSIYPDLFQCSKIKQATVSEAKSLWNRVGINDSEWWTEDLNQTNSVTRNSFFLKIISFNPKSGEDLLIWRPVNGSYTTKSCYEMVRNNMNEQPPNTMWSKIWNLKIPPKIVIFIWKLFHKALPTKELLSSRIQEFSSTCQWCNSSSESATHIFFECEYSIWAWEYVTEWWKLDPTKFTLNHIWCKEAQSRLPVGLKEVWSTTFCSVLWSLWLTRNELIFAGTKLTKQTLQKLITIRSFKWCQANNWIQEDQENIWFSNPYGAILAQSVQVSKRFWLQIRSSNDYIITVAVSKGSFMGKGIYGYAGIIKNAKGETISIFRGPSLVKGKISSIREGVQIAIQEWSPLIKGRTTYIGVNVKFWGKRERVYVDISTSAKVVKINRIIPNLQGVNPSFNYLRNPLIQDAKILANKGCSTPLIKWYWKA